jgi:hypothetical protein
MAVRLIATRLVFCLCTTAGLLLGYTQAHAEAAGNASTKARVIVQYDPQPKVADFPGDDDWFRLQLVKGQDIYIGPDCSGCRVALRDRAGRVLRQGFEEPDAGGGFSYVAPYKGLYFVEMQDFKQADSYPDPYSLTITGDCNGECPILPGQTRYGRIVDGLDHDAFTAPLVAGRTYTATVQSTDLDAELYVLDPKGVQVTTFGPSVTWVSSNKGTDRDIGLE